MDKKSWTFLVLHDNLSYENRRVKLQSSRLIFVRKQIKHVPLVTLLITSFNKFPFPATRRRHEIITETVLLPRYETYRQTKAKERSLNLHSRHSRYTGGTCSTLSRLKLRYSALSNLSLDELPSVDKRSPPTYRNSLVKCLAKNKITKEGTRRDEKRSEWNFVLRGIYKERS